MTSDPTPEQLDPAGVARAALARPVFGEQRIIHGKLCQFIENDDRGDVWEILGPAPTEA